jgi:hypothetical protein
MTEKENTEKSGDVMSSQNNRAGDASSPRPPRPARRRRGRVVAVAAVAGMGAAALVGLSLSGAFGSHANAAVVNCEANPSACGFSDATSTGVPTGTVLKTVPGQVSSGSGWSYSAANKEIDVTGNGAVLSGLSISGSIRVSASNVTINGDQMVTGGTFAVGLAHATGATVENSTISGLNTTSGRVVSAIDDIYGDSTGTVVKNNDISAFRCGVQISVGTITGNYIHNPGYIAGDHTNGVIGNGGTGQLTITHNTILDSLDQTDAITINTQQVPGPVTNKTIEDNLLAGGDYAIYAGNAFGHTTANVLIENNRFGQVYFPKSGQYGPAASFSSTGSGNVWSGNVWDSTGKAVPSP